MPITSGSGDCNTSQWRQKTPSDAFNRHPEQGWFGKLVHFSGFLEYLSHPIQEWVGPADLIIFQRNIVTPQAFDAIQYWQGMGKPVVVDLDDAYQMLPRSNPAYQFWNEREDTWQGKRVRGAGLKYLEEGLRLSNGLLSPNRSLLQDWRYVSGNSYYLPNYAEPAWWVDLPSRADLKKEKGLEGKTVIGWGGSVSHYDSWYGSGIREAAGRVSQRHPEVIWLICGNDARIFNSLPVSRDQKVLQPGVPPDVWPRLVKSFDIGLAPLFGLYDQRRSWIKGIEYALAGVPWVGTAGEPYKDIADLGTLVPNGADAWEEALEAVLSNLKSEQELAGGRVEAARLRFLVDSNLPTFHRVYSQIKQDFVDSHAVLPGLYFVTDKEFASEPAAA